MRDEFRKNWGQGGYTEAELYEKLRKVNEAYEPESPKSQWQHARFEPDPRGGWMVVIETKR